MPQSPSLDLLGAHRWFSANCFNRVWELIEKDQRSAAEDEEMLIAAMASLWHWQQRPDVTSLRLSIGYWQISRVYALLGQGENARGFGERCLAVSGTESPFYLGYAHEALARAAKVLGDVAKFDQHLARATAYAAQVTEVAEREALERDLIELRPSGT